MAKYNPSAQEQETGGNTSSPGPSLQQSGPLPKQDHPKRPGGADAYSSGDDDKAEGYGKTTGQTDHSSKVTPRRSY